MTYVQNKEATIYIFYSDEFHVYKYSTSQIAFKKHSKDCSFLYRIPFSLSPTTRSHNNFYKTEYENSR